MRSPSPMHATTTAKLESSQDMSELNVVLTLRRKRDEIAHAIVLYEKRLEAARRDLAHVNATLPLYENGDPSAARSYHDLNRLFRRGEIVAICKDAMAEHGALSTRERSHHVMKAKASTRPTTSYGRRSRSASSRRFRSRRSGGRWRMRGGGRACGCGAPRPYCAFLQMRNAAQVWYGSLLAR